MQSIILLALSLHSAAQDYGGSSSPKSSSSAMAAAASSSPSSASIHVVDVGKSGFVFSPNSLTAAVGDQIEFHFDNPTHSVAQGDFNNACQPSGDTAFWSGFPSGSSAPFTVTVNDTNPIWFYCAQVTHCQGGMVGVINPPSGQTVADYATAAGKTSSSKAPANIQGGVFAAASQPSGSPSASGSSSATAAPKPTNNGAGRELGVGFAAVMGAGLLVGAFLLG